MVKSLYFQLLYRGQLSIADTFSKNLWCPLLRGFTVVSWLIKLPTLDINPINKHLQSSVKFLKCIFYWRLSSLESNVLFINGLLLLLQGYFYKGKYVLLESKPGGRTLLDGACNVQTPPHGSYPNRGSRRLDSNPKRRTLKQNFTPKRVDFLGQLILHNSIE